MRALGSKMDFFRYRYVRAFFILLLIAFTSIGHVQTLSLPDPLKAGWRGNQVCEQLYEDVEKRILRCTFPPDVGHERHFHVAHFGYAIKGGLVQIIDAKGLRQVELTTGSSYSSDGVAWHEILNIGKTTIVYLIVESKGKPS